jgi:hypothetical protein
VFSFNKWIQAAALYNLPHIRLRARVGGARQLNCHESETNISNASLLGF